ncbi:MAG: argininosuccinate lyase [Thermoanaerobaculia bacterium]
MSGRRDLWGGRFESGPAEVLRRFNDSWSFDRALLAEDVAGSIAWAEALGRCGVLSNAEARKITKGLREVLAAWEAGEGRDADAEDVHSYVEGALGKRIGPLAGKLHTGRSRNDQVATDLRLWLRGAFDTLHGSVLDLAEALTARAAEEAATPMPGYTHSKRAEPVTFGHWCLAYVEMLLRDADRVRAARKRANECPLGSGALSGTPLPIDRERLARSLGFDRATASSLDGVSDRDAAVEYLFVAALHLSHLSRMAEDLVFFTCDETGFAELPDALSTGSSRMPQKKNPDVLELARGHAGRSIGELAGLLALLKGLPLAYDKDLQLDKEPLFRTRAVLDAALPALTALASGLKLRRERMREAASDDRLLATELADALARRGVPFRQAHEVVGRRFAAAETGGMGLLELPPADGVTEADLESVDLGRALARRGAIGGTSPKRVAQAARKAAARIASERRAGAGSAATRRRLG